MKSKKNSNSKQASVAVDANVHNIIDPATMEIEAIYKERSPAPGKCRVLMINFEERRVEMTNGFCRYYPSFDEIILYFANDKIRHDAESVALQHGRETSK